jgi:hypothetical protein
MRKYLFMILLHYRLLTKRNIRHFKKNLNNNFILLNNNKITKDQFDSRINGFLGYSKFANSYNLNKKLISIINY